MVATRVVAARAASVLCALILPIIPFVAAAQGEKDPKPGATQGKEAQSRAGMDAEELLSAIVKVKMKAIAEARSSATLGVSREGSGVVIDDQGHVLTIGYVVIEAESIEVTTQDNRTVPATLAGYDHATGFGLLHAAVPLGVKPMRVGNSAELALREPVMILPHGGRETASLAYVVSKRKFAGSWEYLLDSAIFTAPPTLHWAGAALVNREGKLVGIGSLLVRDTAEPGTPLPGNMFVPIDILKPILPDLVARGKRAGAQRPWLGLATEEVQGRLFVVRVSPGSPAERAGLRQGDIVLGIGSDVVATHEDLYRKLWSLGAAGVEVPLRILQGAEMKEVNVHSIDRFEYFKDKPTY